MYSGIWAVLMEIEYCLRLLGRDILLVSAQSILSQCRPRVWWTVKLAILWGWRRSFHAR